MLLLKKLLVLLESEVIVVEFTASPEMSVHATDVTSLVASLPLLVRFKVCLAVAFAVFALDHLEHRLRFSGRYLAVLGDHPLLEVFIVPREERSGAEVREVGLDLSEDRIVEIVHKIMNSGFLR